MDNVGLGQVCLFRVALLENAKTSHFLLTVHPRDNRAKGFESIENKEVARGE